MEIKKLEDVCEVEYGTRVVQQKDGGSIFPVYGGGGATFSMDVFNRENSLVIARFAMSKQCSRFIKGKFFLNDSGLTIKPKSENELNQEYLNYQILYLNDKIYSLSRGTAQRNLNVSKFRNLQIVYPKSLSTQIQIANVLSKAETLIEQRKQSIALLDEFLKSTFANMFGNPVTNSKKIKKEKLKEFLVFLTSGSRGWNQYYSKKGNRFIRSFDVQMNSISNEDAVYVNPPNNQEAKRTAIKPGDILLTITGSKIGRVSEVPKDFGIGYVSQHVAILRVKNILPLYLSYYLSDINCGQYIISKNQYGQTKPGLNFRQIEGFEILNPPIELQNQFAAIVTKTEALKEQYKSSLQELENLYGSLSQKAFKGELFNKVTAYEENNLLTLAAED